MYTRLHRTITIREENAIAALEVMSRFAADPKWLIYLPPTMSPSETSKQPGLLEHPAEAFAYFRMKASPRVVCEEKHMGSRAVVVVCRDEEAARSASVWPARARHGLHAHGPALLRRRCAEAAMLLQRVRAALDTPQASGTSSRPTGSAWTAS